MNIKSLLDKEVAYRDTQNEISYDKPDPILVAHRYNDEYISLIIALFSYGNAKSIVKFLDSLDFDLIDKSEEKIRQEMKQYYRFQTTEDIVNLFISIKRLKSIDSLENIFLQGYRHKGVLEGIDNIISNLYNVNNYLSKGYKFLVGSNLKRDKNNQIKHIANSPYKRYNMFLRWMVRDDNIDMGLWKSVDKKDLILPLDTHTFAISKKLRLLDRNVYDLKSAILITNQLKKFDENDPIKYDFALYRIGQESQTNIFS